MKYIDKYGNRFTNPIQAYSSDIKIASTEALWNFQCLCVGTIVTAAIMRSFRDIARRNNNEIL